MLIVDNHLHLKIDYQADNPIKLPDYPASAWRGAFGHALRNSVCLSGLPQCQGCHLQPSCAYTYLFETPVFEFHQRGVNTSAPHPYALTVQNNLPTANHFSLQISLVGRAASDYLAEVLFALSQTGERGIGSPENRMKLQQIHYLSDNGWQVLTPKTAAHSSDSVLTLPPPKPSVRLDFHTPLRLKQDDGLVGYKEVTPLLLFRTLLNRLYHLAEFHNLTPPLAYPLHLHPVLRQKSFKDKHLQWLDLDRFSARQQRKHKIGGLVGYVEMELDDLAELWPALWQGQYLHVGKLAAMGLGHYTLS